jgi:hypothetical protein
MLTSSPFTASITMLTSTRATSVRTPVLRPSQPGPTLIRRLSMGSAFGAGRPTSVGRWTRSFPMPTWRTGRRTLLKSQGLARGWSNPGPVGDAWRVRVGWREEGRCGARRELFRERSCDGSQGARSFFSAGVRATDGGAGRLVYTMRASCCSPAGRCYSTVILFLSWLCII